MLRFGLLLPLLLVVFSLNGSAQREIEKKEIRIEPKAPVAPAPKPRKPVRARNATQGVLLVLTNPLRAYVTIKNSRGKIVNQAWSENGELRTDIPPGKYDVEVTADKYYPYPLGKGKLVTASRQQTVTAYLKPTTGSMIIGPVDADVAIFIDDKKPSDLDIKVSRKEEKQIELDDVPEGYHTLTITGRNIVDWKREKVQIQGGATSYITPTFQAVVVNFTIKTEPGAEVYLDGVMAGKATDRGELPIPGKKPGKHTIRVEKDKFEAAQKSDNFGVGDVVVEVKLAGLKSSSEFAEYFLEGPRFWDAPASWQITGGKMTIKGSDVGFLKDRLYDDFRMEFDISFVDGKGAAWIIRARDKKNYYLFQLSGPKASAKVFRSYIYRNGQPNILNSEPIVEDLSRPRDQFHVVIEAKGSTIKHYIKPASRATAAEPLGTVVDTTFSIGSIGFVAVEGEEFVVYFVNVFPYEAKSR